MWLPLQASFKDLRITCLKQEDVTQPLINVKKGKTDEKDCKKSGKKHCQELERSQRIDDQNFGLQSVKRQTSPQKLITKNRINDSGRNILPEFYYPLNGLFYVLMSIHQTHRFSIDIGELRRQHVRASTRHPLVSGVYYNSK